KLLQWVREARACRLKHHDLPKEDEPLVLTAAELAREKSEPDVEELLVKRSSGKASLSVLLAETGAALRGDLSNPALDEKADLYLARAFRMDPEDEDTAFW